MKADDELYPNHAGFSFTYICNFVATVASVDEDSAGYPTPDYKQDYGVLWPEKIREC